MPERARRPDSKDKRAAQYKKNARDGRSRVAGL